MTLAKRIDLTNAVYDPAADINKDSKVNLADITWYVQYLTGQTAVFPQ